MIHFQPEQDSQITNEYQIHRHHKRTPYQSNTFPIENDTWYCDGTQLYHYGQPSAGPETAASTYWQIEENSPFNVVPISGFRGTCAFPQITRGGLQDSWEHGRDLYEVYHDLLGFLPDEFDRKRMEFRVTNNVITSQVAGMVVGGMYKEPGNVPLNVQVGRMLTSDQKKKKFWVNLLMMS